MDNFLRHAKPPVDPSRRRFVAGAAAALGAGLLGRPVQAAAAYPNKPVTIISPFATGGVNDFLARLAGAKLGELMGATFIVDNRTGANGMVGSGYVAKSAPDGYTLLMGSSATHGTNPTLYPDQPYDAVKDFAPVGMIASVPVVVAVNSALPVHSVADLIAYGKSHPGQLSFGSSGVGGTGHLCGEALKAAADIDMVHIPYKGDAPALSDVMGGQLSAIFVGIASMRAAIASGKVRIIATSASKRLDMLPSVPTLAEAGFKNIEFYQWYGLFAKAGTPSACITALNGGLKKILSNPEVMKSIADQGALATYMTPTQFGDYSKAEIQRSKTIIQRLNIKI
jgi:tripartite-type tricarboxylate transporter receptor subunit TctC